jgi:hypothetical protein
MYDRWFLGLEVGLGVGLSGDIKSELPWTYPRAFGKSINFEFSDFCSPMLDFVGLLLINCFRWHG